MQGYLLAPARQPFSNSFLLHSHSELWSKQSEIHLSAVIHPPLVKIQEIVPESCKPGKQTSVHDERVCFQDSHVSREIVPAF